MPAVKGLLKQCSAHRGFWIWICLMSGTLSVKEQGVYSVIFIMYSLDRDTMHIGRYVALIAIAGACPTGSIPAWGALEECLAQHLRRWHNIKPALVQRLVYHKPWSLLFLILLFIMTFEGNSQQTQYIEPMLGQCWPAVYDVGPTLTPHWINGACLLGTVLQNEGLKDKDWVPPHQGWYRGSRLHTQDKILFTGIALARLHRGDPAKWRMVPRETSPSNQAWCY